MIRSDHRLLNLFFNNSLVLVLYLKFFFKFLMHYVSDLHILRCLVSVPFGSIRFQSFQFQFSIAPKINSS